MTAQSIIVRLQMEGKPIIYQNALAIAKCQNEVNPYRLAAQVIYIAGTTGLT